MTGTLLLLGGFAAVALWWLSRQGLAAKPWLEVGVAGEEPARMAAPTPTAKVGLGVFIAVASTLLVLLVSAYSMRMEMADWSPPPRPRLLWANSFVLVLASAALHRATRAARQGRRDAVRAALLLAGGAGLLFLCGQLLAWRELAGAGYRPANNPADAFFYLITAAHGLHLLGGLVALGRTGARLRSASPERLRLSVELCATYWHFLLVAWVMLLLTLAFAPPFDWLIALCTAPLR